MLAAADCVISQLHMLHMLRISKSVNCVLRIPMLSVSCQEAVTLVIKPCALIPNSVHTCCTLVPGILCHPSHGTDCPKTWEGLATPTEILSPCIIGYLNSDLTRISEI